MEVAFLISVPLYGFLPPSLPVAAHHTAFGGADNPVAVRMRVRQTNDVIHEPWGTFWHAAFPEAEQSIMWAMSGFQNEQKKEHQGEAEFADSGTISSVLALAMVAFPCMVPGAPV